MIKFRLIFNFLLLTAVILAAPSAYSSDGHGHGAIETQAAKSTGGHGTPDAKATPPKSGWSAIQEIQAGNKRFTEGRSNGSNQDRQTREKLASGQQPPVIILSCSDSRVPPEKIFDQGLGQMFTVRLAGHVVNAEAIASIEYAIEHLGSTALVVMGHDSCGAVKAALTTPQGKSAGSPSLDSLIAKIKPGIAAFSKIAPDDKTIEGPVRANVTATLRELVKTSKIVRNAVESNRLVLAQGIYHLASGEVEFWSLGTPIVIIGDTRSNSSPKRVPSSNGTEE